MAPSKSKQRQKILQLFRLFGECSILLRFTVHTDITVEKLQEVLNDMEILQKVGNSLLRLLTLIFLGSAR
jgi:hypothetical protein